MQVVVSFARGALQSVKEHSLVVAWEVFALVRTPWTDTAVLQKICSVVLVAVQPHGHAGARLMDNHSSS